MAVYTFLDEKVTDLNKFDEWRQQAGALTLYYRRRFLVRGNYSPGWPDQPRRAAAESDSLPVASR